MRIQPICVFLSGFLMLTSCGILPDNSVNIRVRNNSEYRMDSIQVFFSDGGMNYGNLGPGQSSSYKEPAKAYRYAAVEASIQGKKAALIPIDYVGEEYLEEGDYTYIISIVDSAEQFVEGEWYYFLGIELE